jgi:hypothetical protein
MSVLGKRFERFGLKLHPEKTRLFPFVRPPGEGGGGKGPTTFDFLGFTVHWRRSWKGGWALGMKTRKARQRRALVSIEDWCRRHRCLPILSQRSMLSRKLTGHYNYFAISGNDRCVGALYYRALTIWRKWLRRRSQRTRMTWERYAAFLQVHPLPKPTVRTCLWV